MHYATGVLWAAALGCAGTPPPSVAPQPGDRVRVTALDLQLHQRVGIVRSVSQESLEVDTLRIPRASVTRLEVQRGHRSHLLAGLGIGFVIGGGIGFLASSNNACEPEGVCTAFYSGASALGGLLLGGAVGLAVRTERWEEVNLRSLGAAGVRDRFAIGLALAF